jgi:hypothetical protein
LYNIGLPGREQWRPPELPALTKTKQAERPIINSNKEDLPYSQSKIARPAGEASFPRIVFQSMEEPLYI